MKDANWLFVFQSMPVEQGMTADGLDLSLVAASFELELTFLFVGDGLLHIVSPDVAANQGVVLPRYTKTFRALADFEIERCYVLDDSLNALNCQKADLTIAAEVIQASDMRSLLHSATQVFNF